MREPRIDLRPSADETAGGLDRRVGSPIVADFSVAAVGRALTLPSVGGGVTPPAVRGGVAPFTVGGGVAPLAVWGGVAPLAQRRAW